jgi:hypothetical protein
MTKLYTLILLLVSTLSFSQDFEGIINYDITYEKIDENITVNIKELEEFLGKKSTFITKDGAYKQLSEGKFMAFQIYNPNESKLYYKDIIQSDTLYFNDLKKFENTEFEYEIIKNADTILNHVCHKLIYKNAESEEHYYFSSDLKQNPKYFQNFTVGNKNKLTELMKSVYLRYDVIYYGISIKSIATEIKHQKMNNTEFDIPIKSIVKEKQL